MLGIDDDDDIDLFSKDDSLMNYYQEQNGPENETIYQFYSRSYQKLCNRIVAPERFKYDPSTDLAVEGYQHNEYDVYARGNTLHMCHWAPKDPKASFSAHGSSRATAAESEDEEPETLPSLCIVYLHTNMRSLVDAKETIPVATMLGAHVISFDLPGCGKSEGQLGGNLDLDVEIILDWVQALIDPTVRIILWARGMSTAPAITLLRRFSISQQQSLKSKLSSSASNSSLASLDQSNNSGVTSTASSNGSSRNSTKKAPVPKTLTDFHIIATILDSPFTSIEEMVQHGLEQFQGRGFSFTKTLLSFLIHRTLTHISKQLQGFNLFSVRPVEEVGDISCPVCIISASCDDYVPVQQGQCIAAQWATRVPLACYPPVDLVGQDITQLSSLPQCRQQLVEFHIFEEVTCKHFDPRPVSVVAFTESFLMKQITLHHQAATVTTPSAILSAMKSMTIEAEGSNHHDCDMPRKTTSGSEATLSVSALISEGAEVSDVAIMQLAELENIANAIDAEVILKQQQQLDTSSDGSTSSSSRSNGGKTPASPATKLTFSSSTSTLRTMTTSLGQSPWWSFSGRFLSSSSAATSSASTSSPPPTDGSAPSLPSPPETALVTGDATLSSTTASSPPPSNTTTPTSM
eukprot:gene2351-1715_t